ncbi:hypothetical protein [Allochromatium palmeri]|uniref:Uncharacterized protein n=1 Tax=Allochromatium palmeri TaxID=231048 RepID=A0A6N8EB10_9GAMM|nr:hypothetical protein [Allochromatium palmeri]MTW20640.1 hypothetical protein [Allochromatium palmeri]
MNQHRWPTQLAAYPYAQPLLIGWQIADRARDIHWSDYEQALDAYLASQDETCSLNERHSRLIKSRDQFQALNANGDQHIGTSLALIRLHAELGDSQAVLDAITQMLELMPWLADSLPDDLQIHINRPFLAPIAAFDHRQVEGDLGQWIQAAIMEALAAAEHDPDEARH